MKLDWDIISSAEELDRVLKRLHEKEIAIDTETTGLRWDSLMLGVSFYSEELKKAWFVPTNYYFKRGISINKIASTFSKYKFYGILHNAKFDLCVFNRNRFKDSFLTVQDDTIILIHLSDTEAQKNMEIRVKEDFGVKKQKFEQIIGKKWDKVDWSKETIDVKQPDKTTKSINLLDTLAKYACEDVYWTHRLRGYYYPQVAKDSELLKVYEKIELPLINVLKDMYVTGVNIRKEVLLVMDDILVDEMARVKDSIFAFAGCVFNMNSPQQKADVLYNKLGYPVLAYTKTGAPSTDSNTLETLAAMDYGVCVTMQEYSVLSKLYSGYVNGIPNMLDSDGRLRGNFNSTGTKTGRFSSDSPNLQNQPNNSAYPVRKAFVPTENYKLMVADYSQIELRIMAHMSKDQKFTDAFLAGADIHQKVADDLGITRKMAKIVNFAVLYGMTYMGLGLQLKLSDKEAKEIIQGFEGTYTGYYRWKTYIEERAVRDAQVTNMFGRVRHLPYIKNYKMRNTALRQAVNSAVQGSAADVIKLAMVNLSNRWKKENQGANILLQVHDELVCEAPLDFVEYAFKGLTETMENVVKLRVPLIAEGVICDSWDAMKGGDVPEYLRTLDNPAVNSFEPWNTLLYDNMGRTA